MLSTDCEDNGMVVHRVLFDIHKTYKQALEEQSGPFFAWLHQVSLSPEKMRCPPVSNMILPSLLSVHVVPPFPAAVSQSS